MYQGLNLSVASTRQYSGGGAALETGTRFA